MDYETPIRIRRDSEPQFLSQAGALATVMKKQRPGQLKKLMGISDKLAALNHERFQHWSARNTGDNSRQALFAFMGDVYAGLDAHTLSAADVSFAQKHLRILSGLYGLLRPLDRIQPYRLEMGTAIRNPGGRDLYAYWHDTLTAAVNEQAAALGARCIVNLASNEYFNAVDAKRLETDIVTPVFKDGTNGNYRVLSFFAKKARGMMARFIVQRRLRRADGMRDFDADGYRYDEAASTAQRYVFVRDRD